MPPQTQHADVHDHSSRLRWFIVNLGRSGSSLLAAILADAGADFGLTAPTNWDPRRGQMEGVAIKRAAHHYRRAHDIGLGRKYVLSPALETTYRLFHGKRYLRRALAGSAFHKIGDLDLVIQPAFRLGYEPRVILNYRQLECMLPSLIVGRTHIGPDQLADEYVRVYRQGLILLHTFGGCSVGYDELQDREASAWAEALAGVTTADPATLLAARGRRLAGAADPPDVRPVYPEAFRLFEAMRELGGRVVGPARQVTRALDARSGDID